MAKQYGYVNGIPNRSGVMNLYACQAEDQKDKLTALLHLVTGYINSFRGDLSHEKIIILCASDENCIQVSEKLIQKKIENSLFTKEKCEEHENEVQLNWARFQKGEVLVSVVHMEKFEFVGLPIPEFFIFLDAPVNPARFSELLDTFWRRKFQREQNVTVEVITTIEDNVEFLKTLKKEMENVGPERAPEWLVDWIRISGEKESKTSQKSLESTSSASSSTPGTQKHPKPSSVYDLRPDEHGKYFCPSYLLRIPKSNGDYEEEDEMEMMKEDITSGRELEEDEQFFNGDMCGDQF